MVFRLHSHQHRRKAVVAVHRQQLPDLARDLAGGEIAVPLLPGRRQDMPDRRDQPRLAVAAQTDAERDLVGREEADAVEIVGQPVRVLQDHLDRPVAVLFVDPHRKQRRNAVPLEKGHDLPHHPMLLPGRRDHRQFPGGDAMHLPQPRDLVLEDLQGIVAEMADDFFRRRRPYPFDQAGAEVFFEGRRRRRFLLDRLVGPELPAELGVDGPGAVELHRRPGEDLGLMDGDGDLLLHVVEGLDPEHRPAGVGVVVGDPADDAAEGFGDMGHSGENLFFFPEHWARFQGGRQSRRNLLSK